MTYVRAERIGSGIAAGLLAAMLILAASSQADAGEKWGPFRGRLVDVETGQGIAGGVVLAVWDRAYPTLAGTATEFHEAREVVSTADGLFEMPRLDPPFFSLNVRAPSFTIFAPGYAAVRWVVTPADGVPLVDPTVIEMRALRTREERLKYLPGIPSVLYKSEYPSGKLILIVEPGRIEQFMQILRREEEALGLRSQK